MGCGGSKNNDRHGRLTEKKISVQIGDQVKASSKDCIVIFVFGGPGSKKGRLVSELVETYGFNFINVEKLLLHHLLQKVPENERVGSSFNAQDAIKDDPQLLSLHWLLGEVSRQMDAAGGRETARFVVDIMPNLKFLINNDIFLSNCSRDMTDFEKEHPINFAINFIQRSAKKNKKDINHAKENLKSDAEKPPMRSDEVDSSRTRRRITLFDNNVRPFIDYFQMSERLISMDVTGASPEVVWSRLCELFASLEIYSSAHVNYLLVFVFDEEQLQQASIEQGGLQPIKLSSLLSGSQATLSETVTALSGYLDRADPMLRTFLIDVRDSCIAEEQQKQEQCPNDLVLDETLIDVICVETASSDPQRDSRFVVFIDEDVAQVPKPVQRNRNKADNKGYSHGRFRAVSSTENRVCLFPSHVNLKLCKDIAILLGSHSLL